MITNTGKSIITKYLLGQTSAYASHIAIGCGTKPSSALSFSATNKAATPYFSTTGTIGTVSGSGPFTTTITGLSSTDGFYIGQMISATAGTGNLGSGIVTVTAITPSTSITISSTLTFTAGTITNIIDVNKYYLVTLTATTDISILDYITVVGAGYLLDGVYQVTTGSTTSLIKYIAKTTWSGSEAIPTGTSTIAKNYPTKTSLDFEMFRVPITSRGYVTETDSSGNTISKIVLTAQLPTEERYEITEFGVYPSSANPTAGNYDSKTIFTFSASEPWVMNSTNATPAIITSKLDSVTSGTITTATNIFNVGVDNTLFNSELRLNRQERCRFYNNILVMTGNLSTLSTPAGTGSSYDMTVTSSTDYIKLSSFTTSFANNSPTDELRLAFSVINKVATDADPTTAKILIKFKHGSEYASFWVNKAITSGNRYYVVSTKLQDIYKNSSFNWNSVTSVDLYSSVEVSTTPSSSYYIALDAMRLENTTSINPLYGLVGYTPVVNVVNGNARPIVKNANTSNFVEFRFVADVI